MWRDAREGRPAGIACKACGAMGCVMRDRACYSAQRDGSSLNKTLTTKTAWIRATIISVEIVHSEQELFFLLPAPYSYNKTA